MKRFLNDLFLYTVSGSLIVLLWLLIRKEGIEKAKEKRIETERTEVKFVPPHPLNY